MEKTFICYQCGETKTNDSDFSTLKNDFMNKLKEVLKKIDNNLNEKQPGTMDELINIVHSTEGAGDYGTHFHIVKYMGYLQGIRVYVTGRKNSYPLPSKGKVYSVFNGVDQYEKAGYCVEFDSNEPTII